MRQAKMTPDKRFGGLAVNVCGDFLQLPPVSQQVDKSAVANHLSMDCSQRPAKLGAKFPLPRGAQARQHPLRRLRRCLKHDLVVGIDRGQLGQNIGARRDMGSGGQGFGGGPGQHTGNSFEG